MQRDCFPSMPRGLPVLLLLAVSLALPRPALSASAISSYVRQHGVVVTLTIPRRSYPQDALVRVRLTVRNVSTRPRSLRVGLQAPNVTVLDSRGNEAFTSQAPLGADTLIVPKGGPRATVLRPGHTFSTNEMIVLRGSRITYSAMLGRIGKSVHVVAGTPIRVSLTPEAPPPVVVYATPSLLHATITPSWSSSSRLYVLNQTACATSSVVTLTGGPWIQVEGSTLTTDAGCAGTVTWRALAGWIGHPAAVIRYGPMPS